MLGKIVEKNNLPEIVLTKEQMGAVKNISEKKHSPFLLLGPAGSGKTEVYIHSILELKKQNPENQFLILVPEKTLTPQALERYGAYFSEEEIVLLSSNLSRGAYFANWQRVKNGEAKIIIGTRMAVFAPFKKLALIVIDEEQDISFKQWEMNPRYDARTVAEKMSELRKCKLIRGSATPSVESFFKTKNDQYDLLTISDSYSPKNKTKVRSTIELVDMKKERWANLPARLPAGRQGRQGLTLVETIVAIAVLSITIVASTAVSATYMKSRISIKKYQANNEELSVALNYLAKDIRMSSDLAADPASDGYKSSISLKNNTSDNSVVYTFDDVAKTLTRDEDSAGAVLIARNVEGVFWVRSYTGIPRITILIKKEGIPEMIVQTTVSMRTKYKD
jgi:prepilin-type N-terminal cleavage/methylation domain-containing protein